MRNETNEDRYFMMFSVIPPFIGFIILSLLPNEPQYKWIKWGG